MSNKNMFVVVCRDPSSDGCYNYTRSEETYPDWSSAYRAVSHGHNRQALITMR